MERHTVQLGPALLELEEEIVAPIASNVIHPHTSKSGASETVVAMEQLHHCPFCMATRVKGERADWYRHMQRRNTDDIDMGRDMPAEAEEALFRADCEIDEDSSAEEGDWFPGAAIPAHADAAQHSYDADHRVSAAGDGPADGGLSLFQSAS